MKVLQALPIVAVITVNSRCRVSSATTRACSRSAPATIGATRATASSGLVIWGRSVGVPGRKTRTASAAQLGQGVVAVGIVALLGAVGWC